MAPTAVVTGAASGIGAATVDALLVDGYRVHAWDVATDVLDARWSGTDGVTTRRVDVADLADVEAGFAGVPDVRAVANVAGVQRAGLIDEMDPASWSRQIEVNLTGTFHVDRCAVATMRRSGGGAVVNMSSMAGLKGAGTGMAAYSASKGGVVALTKALSVEAAQYGIRVNCVCPGFVDTPFNEPIAELIGPEKVEALVQSAIPMKRQAHPREIASVIAFLLSDKASYVTGQPIAIEGGALWNI